MHLIPHLGQKVAHDGEEYYVIDIGFRDRGIEVTASHPHGTLMYRLSNEMGEAGLWHPCTGVYDAETNKPLYPVEFRLDEEDTVEPDLEDIPDPRAVSNITSVLVPTASFKGTPYIALTEGTPLQDVHKLAHLLDTMLSWTVGLPERPDNSRLPEIVALLLAIQYDKEGTYGSSWKGKGEYRGIMANLDRKYDRLDKITDDEIKGLRQPLPTSAYRDLTPDDMTTIGESKIDAVADLANYCILYMSWLRETYPGAFEVWVRRNVPQYLRDKLPFVRK